MLDDTYSDYSLCQGGHVIGAVCLSICQSVSRITEKVMSPFHWNLLLWLGLSVERTD